MLIAILMPILKVLIFQGFSDIELFSLILNIITGKRKKEGTTYSHKQF